MFDYIPVVTDKMVLGGMTDPKAMDTWLFLRPFRNESWFMIGITTFANRKLVEEYNMQGTHIVSIALSWAPYFKLDGCNEFQKECKSEGYLADVMNALGEKMNFTWESHGEINNTWGTTAISGPSNSSGIWGGVVGNVFNGTYQLSIR